MKTVYLVVEANGTITAENEQGRFIGAHAFLYMARLRYPEAQLIERKRECMEDLLLSDASKFDASQYTGTLIKGLVATVGNRTMPVGDDDILDAA